MPHPPPGLGTTATPHRRAVQTGAVPPRFIALAEVAEVLNISSAQAYALVRNGDLPAIQVGGRNQWRVEITQLEDYIQRMYAQTRARVGAQADPGDQPEEHDEQSGQPQP